MTVNHENNENVPSTIGNENSDGPADFEKAISATGYGTFNVLLLLASVPIGWTSVFDTSSPAFILPSAECDLELTLFRKGVLVAVTYAGMITAAFAWNLISDYVGRRSLLLIGLSVDVFCNILSSAVRSYEVFLLLKFFSGTVVGGPLTMLMTYLTEFHEAKYRSRFVTWINLLFALGSIIVPALAWTILPQAWYFALFRDFFVYTSWRIFLLICSLPPVLGLVTMSILPESPKYLMTKGNHDKALKLFRRIYSMNTGRPENTYPIKALLEEEKLPKLKRRTTFKKIQEGLFEMKLLFSRPYLVLFITSILLKFGSMFGFNTLRLWLPQLFAVLNNFKSENWDLSRGSATMCQMLNFPTTLSSKNQTVDLNSTNICTPTYVDPTVFINSTIIATATVLAPFLVGIILVNNTGKNVILLMALLLSGLSSFGANWAQTVPYMLVLASTIIVMTRIACNIIVSLSTDTIPNSLRTTAMSTVTMIGRMGAIAGNLVFPALLDRNCIAAFLSIGSLLIASSFLSFLLWKSIGKLRLGR